MRATDGAAKHFGWFKNRTLRALVVAGSTHVFVPAAQAVIGPPSGDTNSAPVYTALDSWSFRDYTNWTSDSGYSPLSFTNLSFSRLGNGFSLVVDTNVSAWLRYPVYESDGTTNFTVNAGTVAFWGAPAPGPVQMPAAAAPEKAVAGWGASSVPMDAGTIQETFNGQCAYYLLNPMNAVMEKLTNALSNPTWTNGYAAIAGAGELQWDGTLSSWLGASTADQWGAERLVMGSWSNVSNRLAAVGKKARLRVKMQ